MEGNRFSSLERVFFSLENKLFFFNVFFAAFSSLPDLFCSYRLTSKAEKPKHFLNIFVCVCSGRWYIV